MTLRDELVKLFGEHKDASYWQSVETGAVGTHVLYPTDAAKFIVIVKCSCGWTSKTESHIEHLADLAVERAEQVVKQAQDMDPEPDIDSYARVVAALGKVKRG